MRLLLISLILVLMVGCGVPRRNRPKPPVPKPISGVVSSVEAIAPNDSYYQPVIVTFEDGRVVTFKLYNPKGPHVIKKGEYNTFELYQSRNVEKVTQELPDIRIRLQGNNE